MVCLSQSERLGLLLRDQLNKPIPSNHSEQHSLYEAVENARLTLNPFHNGAELNRPPSIGKLGTAPQFSNHNNSDKTASKESWASVVECLEVST